MVAFLLLEVFGVKIFSFYSFSKFVEVRVQEPITSNLMSIGFQDSTGKIRKENPCK